MEKPSTDPRRLFVEQAEDLTEITHQQVSKWRRRLKAPEGYRAMLYGPSYAKAMAEDSPARSLLTASIAALAVMSGRTASTALTACSVWPM